MNTMLALWHQKIQGQSIPGVASTGYLGLGRGKSGSVASTRIWLRSYGSRCEDCVRSGVITLVQCAACFAGLALGWDRRVPFDSDYSGGDDARAFFSDVSG